MKKIVLLMSLLLLVCSGASAQSNVLNRLKNRAKNAVENNIGNKIEKGINNALDGKKQKDQKRQDELNRNNDGENWQTAKEDPDEPEEGPDAVSQNVKSDFVRGSVILFQDDFANEQLGEFPSKWDIDDGSIEVASVNGKKYANSNAPSSVFSPLMENMKSYLPDVYTLEWDEFYCKQGEIPDFTTDLRFYSEDGSFVGGIYYNYRAWGPDCYGNYVFKKGGGAEGDVSGSMDWDELQKHVKVGQWNHFAISFNKRAFKFYINGNRVINLPNVAAPQRFNFQIGGENPYRGVGNVVLAAGAVELYERQSTDLSAAAAAVEKAIAETGKFVTNNILFETGKATLKPESMEEIQKVAEYMKANPTARFEVQGHTDNQGSDKINDPLSQQRAEAVVKALEELGVDPFNLRPVGKGAHEPVADNGTDEGRAKNRRVEFVKK